MTLLSLRPLSQTFGASRLGALGALAAVLLGIVVAPTASDAAVAAGARAAAPGAAARAETDNYVVEIKAMGTYRAGTEGSVEVTLVTKGDYHVNKQYPYKFKVADPAPEGVAYPKAVLVRADGTFDEKKGSFKVPFVASKQGQATIGGTLSLSVCSEANCLMDRVPLEISVDVAAAPAPAPKN